MCGRPGLPRTARQNGAGRTQSSAHERRSLHLWRGREAWSNRGRHSAVTPLACAPYLKISAQRSPYAAAVFSSPTSPRSSRLPCNSWLEALVISSQAALCSSVDALTCRSEEHTSELQSLAYLVCRL